MQKVVGDGDFIFLCCDRLRRIGRMEVTEVNEEEEGGDVILRRLYLFDGE